MTRKQIRKLLDCYRVTDGENFKLRDHDPGNIGGKLVRHADAPALLADGVRRLSDIQEKLYAADDWSLLCVFQAMDAAGKDGTIKHVLSGVNPQGVQVTPFKAPGPDELAHDLLWRISAKLPQRGRIGIFNRSHYEEVLVVRVHPEMLAKQHLPPALVTKHIWKDRLHDIANFESYLARQGTIIRKFFLNVSPEEQRRRLLARLDEPDKNWKFNAADVAERARWDDYMAAYQDAIAETAAPHAPWFVIPADHKWFTRLVVVEAMIEALEKHHLASPVLSPEDLAGLAEARRKLEDDV